MVRRGLDEHLTGLRFDAVEVLHPRAVRGNDVDVSEILAGLTITGTGRRGKFMWLTLSDGAALIVHLRMSGQMLIGKFASPHLRIRAQLSGTTLGFVDQRTFGSWQYSPLVRDPFTPGHLIPAGVRHIAPDPFEAAFDAENTARVIRKKNSAIKTVLLDQSVVSGIGSIYADEAMWAAGIKPTRRARLLRQRDAVNLLEKARDVMAQALEQGGTSFDSLYVNVNGASGYFSRSLHVYGRAGKPCHACATEVLRTVVNGRSAHYCPRCQML